MLSLTVGFLQQESQHFHIHIYSYIFDLNSALLVSIWKLDDCYISRICYVKLAFHCLTDISGVIIVLNKCYYRVDTLLSLSPPMTGQYCVVTACYEEPEGRKYN